MTVSTRPAWFGHPELLPQDDIADAEARLASDDEATFSFRMKNYTNWRCGYGAAVRMWRENFMHTHEEAIALALEKCRCAHDWEITGTYSNINPVLCTGERGNRVQCRKCGETSHQTTYRNNYSGD